MCTKLNINMWYAVFECEDPKSLLFDMWSINKLTLLEWITQATGLKEMDGLQLIIQYQQKFYL